MDAQPSTTTATTDLEIWRAFTAVYGQLAGHLSRELTRATGLSEADYRVLDTLLAADGARARALELRWILQWEKSRLSHHLGRMANRGLIERHDCVEDARGFDIVLTDTGRTAALQARTLRASSLQTLVFDTLGPTHLANLAEISTILVERLAQAAHEDPACRAALAEAFAAPPHPTATTT